jgi:polysaccharide pyruvyl transferase WcaK-like protein
MLPEGALLNWGSYDIDNFGDLLFPFLVEHHLRVNYARIIHVSPTGTRSIWPDARRSCTVADALASTPIAGLIVGGGNLITWTASSSINYNEDAEFSRVVHPSFSWIPFVLLAKYGIPYAYNHVGVAKPIPPEKERLVKTLLEPASYLSCRDYAGKDRLRGAGVTSRIVVGPDSAIDIARVFPPDALHEHYHNEAREKYGIPRRAAIVVIHVKERYLKDQLDEVVRMIGVLRARGLHPVLAPLGMCHRDDDILRDPRLQGSSATWILRPDLLLDLLSLLAVAKFYIGSSLHGAIAALSYGNAVAIVADEQSSRLCKFSGFLAQVDLARCLYSGWRDACDHLVSNGMATFGALNSSKVKELRGRRDTWKDIHRSLVSGRHLRRALVLDRSLEESAKHHYGI